MWLRFPFALLVCLVFSCVGAETPTQIFSRLMENYNRNEAPGFLANKTTEVKLSAYVTSIQYLGDVTSDFLVTFYLRKTWRDPRLSFSTIDGSPKNIRFPEDSWKQVWLPDTFIRYSKDVKLDDDMSSNRLLMVNASGVVWYVMKLAVVIPSRFDLSKYPFGEQRLVISFESFGHQTDSLFFSAMEHPVDVEEGSVTPPFNFLTSLVNDCSQNYTSGAFPCFQMIFVLERTTTQFGLHLYLPSAIIVILSWLAFWIDLDTYFPTRLLIGVLSMFVLILLNALSGLFMVPTQYASPHNSWVIVCYFMVFGTLIQFVVVNILSKISSSARPGIELLKPPSASAETFEEQLEVSGGGKRRVRLVDWFSRILFPAGFLLFNIIYWLKLSA